MIWPPSEVILSNSVLVAIAKGCLKHSSSQMRSLLFFFQYFQLESCSVLEHYIFTFTTSRPILLTFLPLIFDQSDWSNNQCHILLYNHLPEMVDSLGDWTLACDNLLIRFIALKSNCACNITSIDILRLLVLSTSLKQNLRMLIWLYIAISVSVIELLSNHSFVNVFLVIQTPKNLKLLISLFSIRHLWWFEVRDFERVWVFGYKVMGIGHVCPWPGLTWDQEVILILKWIDIINTLIDNLWIVSRSLLIHFLFIILFLYAKTLHSFTNNYLRILKM